MPEKKPWRRCCAMHWKKMLDHNVILFHCLTHQEALCAQIFPPEITEVMTLVTQIINKIMKKGLNHWQFCALLEEVSCQYPDLQYSKIRWLSKGKVLVHFAGCLEDVKMFMQEKGCAYAKLKDPVWLQKFHFMVDIISHLNGLNRKLQGKGNTALLLLEEVRSFERKLTLFARDIDTGSLVHFPSLKQFKESTKYELNTANLKNLILKMQEVFAGQFQEFKKEKATLSFVLKPLEADTSALNFSTFTGVDRAELELELADMQDKDMWASKFRGLVTELEDLEKQKSTLAVQQRWTEMLDLKKQDQIVFDVWNSLPDAYSNMKRYAFSILSIFGSTHLCEQVFSNMNFIKSKLRRQLNDESLQSCLKLKMTAYSPDFERLSEETQQQKSH
ncbi:general transcription factor II-I repeat domain-containing protein 2A-like isoform X2 [Carettochelys insculpta]|uniref:general transcription factor II-I repeat domain-containing protein 2A-like isoform X2 n=1 Tax=Carettochelys insculpta TaxID=44489 RepID=UPI003EC0BC86